MLPLTCAVSFLSILCPIWFGLVYVSYTRLLILELIEAQMCRCGLHLVNNQQHSMKHVMTLIFIIARSFTGYKNVDAL